MLSVAVSHQITGGTAVFHNDRHGGALAFQEGFEATGRVFAQIEEQRRPFVLIGAPIRKLRRRCQQVELWLVLVFTATIGTRNNTPFFRLDEERVPPVLRHELPAEALLEGLQGSRTVIMVVGVVSASDALLFLAVAQRL